MYPAQNQPEMRPAPVDQTTDQKQRRLVIKHQNQFLLLDLAGGMRAQNGAGLGLYVNDTRFLSQWDLTVAGEPVHFLSADADEGYAATLHYSNRATATLPEGAIGITRQIVLDEREIVTETITLRNFQNRSVIVPVSLAFGADFADMFEVRGSVRTERGYLLKPQCGRSRSMTLRYLGRDNILRSTRISFPGRKPDQLRWDRVDFRLNIGPQGSVVLGACIQTAEAYAQDSKTLVNPRAANGVNNHGRRFGFARLPRGSALDRARRAHSKWNQLTARVTTGNADFNRLLERSKRDLYLLRQETPHGGAVAAGVPWFAVPFGRDSLIAGLQTLQFMPEMSRDILAFLAAYQGKKHDEDTCEKPGRIMHELRPGEMAALAEIPFRPYYGTVDATQLWLMLYARYVEWTGDLDFARKHWPTAEAALDYLARECGDGYVTYGGTGALTNQGWKDSGNCIVYSNGELAKGPIAVCEAQGYLYAAWTEVSVIAAKLGMPETAQTLATKAVELKHRFNRDYWMEDHGTAALALDGEGRQCDVVASNAGHLLGTGILPADREQRVTERLMRSDMFSGWGIRTLSSEAAAYHPTDYQVGAVWPHDNGMIASGMCQSGESERAHTVIRAMLDTALSQSDLRLPELFAGYDRGNSKQPVPYQVACIPQLWAAGCAFHMTAGLLGISFDADSNTLKIIRPSVPEWLGHIRVEGLRLGANEVNLYLRRTKSGATTVEIERVSGNPRCLIEC